MASDDGRLPLALIERLTREPYRFDYRQSIRLLEQAAPTSVPLGEGTDLAREAVRLRGSLALRFPPGEIEAIRHAATGQPAEMTLTLLTLAGGFGPLPPPLAAQVLDRARHGDVATRDFLDLFNHRLLSLLARQARLFHPVMQRPARRDATATRPLLSLLGLFAKPADTPGALDETEACLLSAAGLLNPRPVSAHALQRLLAGYLRQPVHVAQFQGGWLPLAKAQRGRLGRGSQPLGQGAVLGSRAWDQGAGLLVSIGPLPFVSMTGLLRGGAAHARVAALVRFALGGLLDVRLRLSVQAAQVPPSRLARAGGLRLGWTTWLRTRPRESPGAATLRLRLD